MNSPEDRLLTEDEQAHIKQLMSELDQRQPGEPLEHPIEEHIKYARLAMGDIKVRVRKLQWYTVLWLAMWATIIGCSVYLVFFR